MKCGVWPKKKDMKCASEKSLLNFEFRLRLLPMASLSLVIYFFPFPYVFYSFLRKKFPYLFVFCFFFNFIFSSFTTLLTFTIDKGYEYMCVFLVFTPQNTNKFV